MIWYSLSVSVCAGATVIESPVCTPIGSRFSIEQTMMQLSLLVAHHLHLELFPAEQRLLDQQLAASARASRPRLHDLDELVLVVGDAAAGAAQRERGPDHRREADRRLHLERLLQAVRDARARGAEADARHRRLELLAVLGLVDRLLATRRSARRRTSSSTPSRARSSAQLSAVWPPIVGSSASGRSRSMMRRHHLPGDRLDVGDVGHLRVGHDRRRVAS